MAQVWARLAFPFTFVDAAETANIAAAVTPRTKMVYAETPTNPMMRLCDLAAAGEIARRAGALFVVDNTFATPYFQRPLELGADVVLHSTTKYLNGHSDMVGGMLVANRDDLAERIGFVQNAVGAVPGPPRSARSRSARRGRPGSPPASRPPCRCVRSDTWWSSAARHPPPARAAAGSMVWRTCCRRRTGRRHGARSPPRPRGRTAASSGWWASRRRPFWSAA